MKLSPSLHAAILALAGVAAAADSTSAKDDGFQRFSALPILGYSEETKLQYGAMALVFFRPETPGGEVPEIDISAQGTSRGQYSFMFTPYFYLMHDQVSGWFNLRYQDWVASYFGMGNNPDFDEYILFDRQKLNVGLELESNLGISEILPKGFKYGMEIDLEYADISFRGDKSGKADSEAVRDDQGDPKDLDGTNFLDESADKVTNNIAAPDANSGFRNGLGYLLAYDTRDNKNWARHGFLLQWQQMFYSDLIGDYSYQTETLDLRGYTYLFWKTSMAVGALWQRTSGDTPFDKLSGPDGIKRFRGVESLYFRDNQSLILQAELRKVLFWRLAGDIFFEGGKVGDHFSELLRNQWHRAIGFGGELALNLKESLYARGEFSWIDNEHLALTVYIRQAF